MKPNQQSDSLLIDLLFKRVDFLIFGNYLVAELAVAGLEELRRLFVESDQ